MSPPLPCTSARSCWPFLRRRAGVIVDAAAMLLSAHVEHPQIGGVAAAIVLAPPDHRVPIESEFAAVGRIAAPVAPIGEHRLFDIAGERDFVQVRDAGKHQAARRLEDDLARVARPTDDGVAGTMEGKLPGLAALGRHDEDVKVAEAVAGKSDPFAVGREAGMNVAGGVNREPLRIGAVLVDQPEVAQVAEDDLAVVVIGVADELDLDGVGAKGPAGRRGGPAAPPSGSKGCEAC